MTPTSHLFYLINGDYGIPADNVLQCLTASEVNNMYNSFDGNEINLDNIHNPVHKLYFDFRAKLVKDPNNVCQPIVNCFNDLMEVNSLISECHRFETFDHFFECVIQSCCNSKHLDQFNNVISAFVINHEIDLIPQFFQHVITKEIKFFSDNFFLNCSFLVLGRYPEVAESLINMYVTYRNTSYHKINKHVFNSITSSVFVSLSVWGHFDMIDKLLDKHKQILVKKNKLKLHCKFALYLPLCIGLIDVMEYWYDYDFFNFSNIGTWNIAHLIPEQSWIWLSHPDKKPFWKQYTILSKEVLQNDKLMKVIVKLHNFQLCIKNDGFINAMKSDRIDSFDLLIDNLPSDYISGNDCVCPLSDFFSSFRRLDSLLPWYNYTDEDDKMLFEKDELTFEELEKRKRIRYYGRRILQIKGLERRYISIPNFRARQPFLFKWIGSSSSLNDNFDYESVINKLKINIDISTILDFPYKDFVHFYRKRYLKYSYITEINERLIEVLNQCAPIENVLLILLNTQLFEHNQINSSLNEDVDFNDHSLLVKLLFGLYNCQNYRLTKTEHFKYFKRDIEESREKWKSEGKQDIFEGLNESECILRDKILDGFINKINILSNLNVCKLLKEKHDINLTVVLKTFNYLLPYPSLIEELPDDCFVTAYTNNKKKKKNNYFFQTSFGNIVFEKEFFSSFKDSDVNYADSLDRMKRLFDVAKDYLPTFIIKEFNANSICFANNYPVQITVEISKNTSGNEAMLLKFYSILAKKQAIVDFCDSISVPKEILDLFGDDGLQLGKFYNSHMLNADHYPSLNFLKCVLRKYSELNVKVTLKTLEEYFNDPAFKEMIIKHKPQILPDWRDISMKQIEKYYEITSIMQPCIIDLDEPTGLLNLWPIYVKKANKYPNLFKLKYSEDLLNNATENIKLHILYAFSNLGLPAKFSYNSIQYAFEEGYIGVMNWWAKSGLLDPRFKLNLDKVPEDEKILNWANDNKHLIGNVSYSSAGINNISDLFDDALSCS